MALALMTLLVGLGCPLDGSGTGTGQGLCDPGTTWMSTSPTEIQRRIAGTAGRRGHRGTRSHPRRDDAAAPARPATLREEDCTEGDIKT